MRAAWTAFAAGGDPGWPAFDAAERLVQPFDARSEVTAYPEGGTSDFVHQLPVRRRHFHRLLSAIAFR